MRGVLVAALLLGPLAAAARAVPVWFDARAPYARPLVRGQVAGRRVALVLDTGSPLNVLGLSVARAARLALAPAPSFRDFLMQERTAQAIADPLALDGGVQLDGVSASDWGDVLDSRAPGGPHADGVVSPQSLGGVVLIDFLEGTFERSDWREANDRLAPLLAVGEARAQGGHYLLDAQVGGRAMTLAVDTGAPTSLLYAPREDDVPDGMSRISFRRARVRVGPLARDLSFDVVEPIAEPSFDGLLGMDVLRDCVLALDRERLRLGCRAQPSGPGGSSQDPHDGYRRHWLVGEDPAAVLEERVNGDLIYVSPTLTVVFHPDGSFICPSFWSMRCPATKPEMEWLIDKTARPRAQILQHRFIEQSLDRLPRHLASVWSERRWSAAERREILFELWDEAAEPDDRELASAGATARRAIERFVRRELPPGSPDAFTVEELVRMNARRGAGEPFSPYRKRPRNDQSMN